MYRRCIRTERVMTPLLRPLYYIYVYNSHTHVRADYVINHSSTIIRQILYTPFMPVRHEPPIIYSRFLRNNNNRGDKSVWIFSDRAREHVGRTGRGGTAYDRLYVALRPERRRVYADDKSLTLNEKKKNKKGRKRSIRRFPIASRVVSITLAGRS